MMDCRIIEGDALDLLKDLDSESVQCCVTSPPYWGLRNYGHADQIGQEKSPEEYIAKLVKVFVEVKRVLRADGTLWLNLGDSYAAAGKNRSVTQATAQSTLNGSTNSQASCLIQQTKIISGLKPKDLVGIPWMLAFALRADGWYLRSEITWLKRASMPESVTDRPTSATEKIFLLSKSPKYFYDSDAVRQPPIEALAKDRRWETGTTEHNKKVGYELHDKQRGHSRRHAGFNDRWDQMSKSDQIANGSNMRNYWLLSPEPFSGSHFATFPTEVPRRAILAGSRSGDTILDPFAGSGTTGKVALELGRRSILLEINPDYCAMAKQRCHVTAGLML